MARWVVFVVLASALLFVGVEFLTRDQLAKKRLIFPNGEALTVEIADTVEDQNQGLSGRTQLGGDEGMLFVFPTERTMRFWMRDTNIPLSIGFFDKNKTLMSTRDMEPQALVPGTRQFEIYHSNRPGLFALEVNQGWFRDNEIVPGMTFELSEPD
jgi:uncharacterized membrane protein (UPF0127 family)